MEEKLSVNVVPDPSEEESEDLNPPYYTSKITNKKKWREAVSLMNSNHELLEQKYGYLIGNRGCCCGCCGKFGTK